MSGKYNREKQVNREMAYLAIPRWKDIPFLVHGFGTGEWEERDFKRQKGWKDFNTIFLEQVHSDIVHFIEEIPKRNLMGDALITRLPQVFLIVKTADCLPVLIVDERQRAIAAVHCGWRGTQKRVLEKVLDGLEIRYGCRPESLLVALGPCIGPFCYEVGEDVKQSFEKAGFQDVLFESHPVRRGKYFFDLRKANLLQLQRRGVIKENIFRLDVCSHCETSFPSFRRDGKKASRMLSFIGMSF